MKWVGRWWISRFGWRLGLCWRQCCAHLLRIHWPCCIYDRSVQTICLCALPQHACEIRCTLVVVRMLLFVLCRTCTHTHTLSLSLSFFHPGASYWSALPTTAFHFQVCLTNPQNKSLIFTAACTVGPRVGFGQDKFKPHNIVYTVIGGSLLWVGWFGFNAGSAVSASPQAGFAMMVTQICAATSGFTWMLIEYFTQGKPSVLGIVKWVLSQSSLCRPSRPSPFCCTLL